MRPGYGIERGDLLRATALGAWLLLCDGGLKLVARLGACGAAADHGSRELLTSSSCASIPLVADLVQIVFAHPGAALFGLAPGSVTGSAGTIHVIACIVVAAALTGFVFRWRWRVAADAHALACIWSGVLMDAAPRFVTDGAGIDELLVGGVYLGLADLVIVWGLAWLGARVVAESRG